MRNATWIASLLVPALFIFSNVSFAANLALSGSELSDLRFLHENQKQFASKLDSKSPVVAALASAIAYREDPDNNRQRIFKAFSVADYRFRANGNHNIIDAKQLSHQADALEKQNPNLPDRVYLLLLSFIYYQDRNEWVTVGEQRISAARFFRTGFLAAYYKGTSIDVLKLAHDIDLWTQKSMEEQ